MVTNDMRRPSLRLTRRGRLAILGLFVLLASFASAVLFATASRASDPRTSPVLFATASRASDPGTAAAPTVVVRPHDTLWSIASRTSPRRDPYATVAEIRRLNGLPGYVIHPGDTLILPCR